MSKFVDIEIDKRSADLISRGFKRYGLEGGRAIVRGIRKTAFDIETDAKERLRGELGSEKHIVTGRLRASVHTEMKGVNSFKPKAGASDAGDRTLGVSPDDDEAYVGTNVEYADKIEFYYDSFLRWSFVRNMKRLAVNIRSELRKLDKNFK